MYCQGYTPQLLAGYSVNNEVQFAGVWVNTGISGVDMNRIDTSINNYMRRNNVPGLCVAFCKGDRLVFAKGYGNAVKESGDPAFMNYGMTHGQIIQWELNNEIITHAPGSSEFYLNFGYILLARIIEKVSGAASYEQYLQAHVFNLTGSSGMQIGKNDLSQRLPNEVEYYGGDPYGLHLDRMDGNGGWIASALDLAKVVVHINGNHGVPDILPPAQMNMLTQTEPASGTYGCGFIAWLNSAKGHNGAMDGTKPLLHDAGDGGGWVVVFNTRASQDGYAWGLDGILGGLYSSVNWPA